MDERLREVAGPRSWASIRGESGRRQATSGPARCLVLDAGNRVTRVRIPNVPVRTTPDRVAPTTVECREAELRTRATLEDVGPSEVDEPIATRTSKIDIVPPGEPWQRNCEVSTVAAPRYIVMVHSRRGRSSMAIAPGPDPGTPLSRTRRVVAATNSGQMRMQRFLTGLLE